MSYSLQYTLTLTAISRVADSANTTCPIPVDQTLSLMYVMIAKGAGYMHDW